MIPTTPSKGVVNCYLNFLLLICMSIAFIWIFALQGIDILYTNYFVI